MRFYWVDAFTKEAFGGNPTGVAIGECSEQVMQGLAKELGLSYIAFVNLKSGISIRYFTPEAEIDLCGHATIAAFFALAAGGYVKTPNGTSECGFSTRAGNLKVYMECVDGAVESVHMLQARPRFGDKVPKDRTAYYLGISEGDIIGEPMVVSAGAYDIVAGICDKRVLNRISADAEKIAAFTGEYNAAALQLFTFDTYLKEDAVLVRTMVPTPGIGEMPAAGTANGALGAYLAETGLADGNPLKFKAEQGINMGRPSLISVEVAKGAGYQVKVGGSARIIMEGDLRV